MRQLEQHKSKDQAEDSPAVFSKMLQPKVTPCKSYEMRRVD